MNLIHEVINYLTTLPASTWTTLASYLGGSTAVAGTLQVAKHKLNFADADKLVVFALGFLSFIAAFVDVLLQSNATNPLPQLGHITAALIGGAVVVHRFFVSPAYYGIAAKLKKFDTLLKEVETQEAKDSAAAPAAVTQPAASTLPDESNLAQFQV